MDAWKWRGKQDGHKPYFEITVFCGELLTVEVEVVVPIWWDHFPPGWSRGITRMVSFDFEGPSQLLSTIGSRTQSQHLQCLEVFGWVQYDLLRKLVHLRSELHLLGGYETEVIGTSVTTCRNLPNHSWHNIRTLLSTCRLAVPEESGTEFRDSTGNVCQRCTHPLRCSKLKVGSILPGWLVTTCYPSQARSPHEITWVHAQKLEPDNLPLLKKDIPPKFFTNLFHWNHTCSFWGIPSFLGASGEISGFTYTISVASKGPLPKKNVDSWRVQTPPKTEGQTHNFFEKQGRKGRSKENPSTHHLTSDWKILRQNKISPASKLPTPRVVVSAGQDLQTVWPFSSLHSRSFWQPRHIE